VHFKKQWKTPQSFCEVLETQENLLEIFNTVGAQTIDRKYSPEVVDVELSWKQKANESCFFRKALLTKESMIQGH